MGTTLERTTFSTSRLMEFFTTKELQMQIGHARDWWPVALLKELIDNALDACEAAGTPPDIAVTVGPDMVSVRDNGPGLPVATLERSLDYAVRVSDKTHYVSPSRGQLGNALKCVWAAPFVASGKRGRVDIVTGGNVYRVDVTLDQIAQRPNLQVTVSPDGIVKTGTLVKMHWPGIAGSLRHSQAPPSYKAFEPPCGRELVQKYSAFNPHASFTYDQDNDLDFGSEFSSTTPDWRKWAPGDPTSPHWYTSDRLRALIAAYLAEERDGGKVRTVREFVSEFKGLAGTAKQKRVTEAVGLTGAPLAALVSGDDIDRERVTALLGAMQAEARPVKPSALGVIGEEHFTPWLAGGGVVAADSVRYAKRQGTTAEGLPFVVEVALGVNTPTYSGCGRDLFVGLNWAPALKVPFENLHHLLAENYVDQHDPLAVVVHLACPLLEFTDRGKSKLELPAEIADALRLAVGRAAKEWKQLKGQMRREQRAEERELSEMRQARERRKLSIKGAAYQVMERAYLKASAGGTLPANARQVMYAARPWVKDLTGGKCWKNSSYFTQHLLPDYVDSHPEAESWNVVFDARGHIEEPHTGRKIGLGTVEVRQYIARWTDNPTGLGLSEPLLGFSAETSGPTHCYRWALFVEKEGFDHLWKARRIAERYDLAIMSTKGMSVTAARELVEELSKKGVTILVLHDFDKAGFSIVHTLQSDTRRYTFDTAPNVIDLGFRLEDIEGLERESVTYNQETDPALNLRESGATERECSELVQRRAWNGKTWYGERVELNAMTSAQLVQWLEGKLDALGVGKVIPSPEVMAKAYRRGVMLATIQRAIDDTYRARDWHTIEPPEDLADRVAEAFDGWATERRWDDVIWSIAKKDARR